VTKFRFADFSNNNTIFPLIFAERLLAVRRVLMIQFGLRTRTSENTEIGKDCVGNHQVSGGARNNENPPDQNRRRTTPTTLPVGHSDDNSTSRNGQEAAEKRVSADKVENGSIHETSPCWRIRHGVVQKPFRDMSVS
jgi:hypothetical protein